MRRLFRSAAAVGALVVTLAVALLPGGYLGKVYAEAAAFLETFDGVPATPQDYTNPHNWDIFVNGFNDQEPSVGQHGPNCEPPGFPYNSVNTHPLHGQAGAVYICNNHVMTSTGITGYGAVYMTPPALMDMSAGTAVLKWDMSTLRTAARDWVAVVLTPYSEHQVVAYNNNDQHIPPDNIHVLLAGGGNVFLVSERVGGGSDVAVGGDAFTTWDMVQAAQIPPLVEDAARRDTFEIDLSRTHVRMCLVGNNTGQTYTYQGHAGFCWVDADLPTPLSPSVWGNQASVQLAHHNYNAEKSCSGDEDALHIVHNAIGDSQCPPNTWHWDNVSISPAVPYSIIKPIGAADLTSASPQAVTFQAAAPANTNLEFVTFGTNSAVQVSYDGGATWHHPNLQAATSPGHDESGEMVWDPVPAGVQTVWVQGHNGFWGSYESTAFNLISATPGVVIPPSPAPTPPTSAGPVQGLAAPVRMADTRSSGGAIANGGIRCFVVAGTGGVPSDAAGVALNVTATGYLAPGWLTIFPAGQGVPATSTLNFSPAQYATANSAVVPVGAGGQVCVSVGTINSAPASTQVVLDATGYVPASNSSMMPMLPGPVRLADTRSNGGPIPSGGNRCFAVAGAGGIPGNATGVLLNVTAVGYGTDGWLTVYPAGQGAPATSTLNFDVSEYAMAGGVMAPLGSGGNVCVSVGSVNSAAGGSQVVLDATGYVTSSGSSQMPMLSAPVRLVDTRTSGGPIAAGTNRCFTVAGQAGIPANAAGVVLTVTAVGYGSDGWLTVYPAGQAPPTASTLNFDKTAYAVANGTIATPGSNGQVCVQVGTLSGGPGSANVVLDVLGYVAGANGSNVKKR